MSLEESGVHDDILFTRPESSHLGDCPVCFLPMPTNHRSLVVHPCCCKLVCNGCVYSYGKNKGGLSHPLGCLFCRTVCESEEEAKQRIIARASSKDPVALRTLGQLHFLKDEYDDAFRYFKQGADVGDAESHYKLGGRYWFGDGVERDKEMGLRHLEKAAIAGHPHARVHLGCYEDANHSHERAFKHFSIAASFGCCEAVDVLSEYYERGYISEDEYAESRRAYEAFMDASTSQDRKEAEVEQELKESHFDGSVMGYDLGGGEFISTTL